MSKAKKKAGAAPVIPTEKEVTLSPFAAAQAGMAANLIMEAFAWSGHPWGVYFWERVYEELNRMARDHNG